MKSLTFVACQNQSCEMMMANSLATFEGSKENFLVPTKNFSLYNLETNAQTEPLINWSLGDLFSYLVWDNN